MPQVSRSTEPSDPQASMDGLLADETQRRIAAERALREMEERFDLCLAGSSNGFWEWNVQSGHVWYSRQLLQLLGYQDAEDEWPPTLEPFDQRIHPDDRDGVWEAVNRHLKHGDPYSVEMRLRARNGKYRWFQSRGVAVRDDQHQPLKMAGSIQDIEPRKAAESARNRLNEQLDQRNAELESLTQRLSTEAVDRNLVQQLYHDLFENAPDLYVSINAETGLVEHCNRAVVQKLGFAKSQIIGKRVHELYHPDCLREVDKAFEQFRITGSINNVELTLRTADGTAIPVTLNVSAIRDENGKILASRSVWRDVTELHATRQSLRQLNLELEQRVARRTAELERSVEQLSESERKFRQLAENVQEVFWIANTSNFELEYVSPAFAQIWGWECANGCGCRTIWKRAIVPEDSESAEEAFAIGREGGRFDVEYRIRRPDGTIRWIRDRGFPVADDQEPDKRVTGVALDITEQKKTQQQLADYLKELERQNKELDHFAYIASHDLRAPLRGVRTICGWLREDCKDLLPEASLQHIEELEGRAVRMERMLASILVFARAGRATLTTVPVDIGKLIQGVVDTLDPPDGFVVDLGPDVPMLHTSPEVLEQVFQNLIGNAIKHHDRDRGQITIAWRKLGKRVEFRVNDDGPGIPVEYHDKVFEMFQTLRPRDEVEGSGIGLSVVRKLIETQGGTIRIEPGDRDAEASGAETTGVQPPRGTSFVFTWPGLIDGNK